MTEFAHPGQGVPTVSINPPKTPVTKGSQSIAAATTPNVCKMPGPPAPFVPTPLPNIGKSAMSPDGYSTTVKIEGNEVAIRGASFKSMGDIASKGLGGGIVSMNCEGATKFIAPGSMDVNIEGKSVQYLGDQMQNNCGPSGSPPNAATLAGVVHAPGTPVVPAPPCPGHQAGGPLHHPDTDESFKDRRNAKARDQSKGGKHEHAAAKHNEDDILRLEGSLKRASPGGGTPKSALSDEGETNQVRHTCQICGAIMDGEVDHAIEDKSGKRSAVEAKSGEEFTPASDPAEAARNLRQMQRLCALAANSGSGVVYKLPKGHAKAAAQILKAGRGMGLTPAIVFI